MDSCFVAFCRWARRFLRLLRDPPRFRARAAQGVSREFQDAMVASGWDLEPWEVVLASYVAAAFVAVAACATWVIATLSLGLGATGLAAAVAGSGGAALAAQHLVSEHPKARARYLRIHSMGDIPEVVSYVVMSMKITPNLETALRFAAESSDRPFARDLRRLLFDLSLRVYDGIDDAVSSFAQLWGQWNDYLKRSVYLVRSSLAERDETARTVTLNRALEVVLAGTRAMMEEFAARLHAPTMVLYSLFVMVPLALVAMLPAAAMVGVEVDALAICLTYDLLLPAATAMYARSVLARRPAAFSPPKVPHDHEALDPARRRAAAALALFAGVAVSLPAIPMGPWADGGAWVGPVPRTLFPLWGVALAVAIYAAAVFRPLASARVRAVVIEDEFADALFLLGRRITEGRSPEEAFAHLCVAMPESRIAGVFARAHHNVMAMRMNLRDAFFDVDAGALGDVGSPKVATVMRLFLQSVERSHGLAGVAITKLADHLKELSDVEASIRRGLATMTGMMRTTAALFAPLIGGVTLAISQALSGLAAATFAQAGGGLAGAYGYSPSLRYAAPLVAPDTFVLIIGVYVVLLTVILLRFASGIEHGEDRVAFLEELGAALPVSIAVFSVASVLSGTVFGLLY